MKNLNAEGKKDEEETVEPGDSGDLLGSSGYKVSVTWSGLGDATEPNESPDIILRAGT